jgi:hypothetical protein
MQYKIPVQIENEDTIFLGLSIRQLGIIMIGSGIAYSIFKSLEAGIGPQAASIPAIFIVLLALFVALFRNSEMTFLPFILNMIRLNLNTGTRVWTKGTESYSNLEIGYVVSYATAKAKHESKAAFHEMEEQLADNL